MPMSLKLIDSVQYLKGVGPSVAQKLNKLGIEKVEDLLYYFPRDYEDRRALTYLHDARDGERATFKVEVVEQGTIYYKGKNHPKIKIADRTGIAYLYCFHRNYLKNILKTGTSLYLTGVPGRKYKIPVFAQFDFEVDNNGSELRILPVYRLTAGLSQKSLRKLVEFAIIHFQEEIHDDLPEFIRKGYKFKARRNLIKDIHFPDDMSALRRVKEALSYEEFFKYQLVVAMVRSKKSHIVKKRTVLPGKLKLIFLHRLPFQLTRAQERVLGEIESDLRGSSPMNRLIQGDVGSGKTVVALIAALDIIEGGGQVALMAPTEILAHQHYSTITAWLENTGVKVEFLSGSVKGAQRNELTQKLLNREIDILIGTHALFSDDVHFKNLALVIIDEQHKFGVLQRGRLREKGEHPDCLVMSATPIPRTLSMTLYGDLDVSVIDEIPAGRGGIKTAIIRQAGSHKVFDKVREEITAGRQAYFIYPLIEESSSADLKNALDAYEWLRNDIFKEFKIGLLHGRLSDEEKELVMSRFKRGEYDIIVATTVIEVGIDVPSATVMVIEQAERFGLSSIHQLRGRIGRGEYPSWCFLIPDRSTGRESFNRLKILKDTQDGFKIAEWDLKLRGPGEIIGKKQSGIPSFIIDNFDINTKLISRAQKDARRFISGEIGTEKARTQFLKGFLRSEACRNALLYFGG